MTDSGMRVGVIGAGYWGKNLVRTCAELNALQAICDADARTREAAADAYPKVKICAAVDELLALDLDAVVVATPAPTHAAIALAVLAAGKHAFIEKPLALTVEEGARVADAAGAAGKIAFVGHLLLYHPAVRRLRELIADGAIGEVWHVRSRRQKLGIIRSAESVWWSFAPHDVALALTILDDEPTAATAAQVGSLQPGIFDMTYADFRFPGDRSAHLEVSWLDPERVAKLEVFGASGVLVFEDTNDGGSLVHVKAGARRDDAGGFSTWRDGVAAIDVRRGDPLREELRAFFDSVRTGREPLTSARRGVAVLRALHMVDAAAMRSFAKSAQAV
jgi:UDP-2-acetamido-3-amino-2,3-dideoxy-glucuronate N-acetyltransferase